MVFLHVTAAAASGGAPTPLVLEEPAATKQTKLHESFIMYSTDF